MAPEVGSEYNPSLEASLGIGMMGEGGSMAAVGSGVVVSAAVAAVGLASHSSATNIYISTI